MNIINQSRIDKCQINENDENLFVSENNIDKSNKNILNNDLIDLFSDFSTHDIINT
jgi:hypothetical protein